MWSIRPRLAGRCVRSAIWSILPSVAGIIRITLMPSGERGGYGPPGDIIPPPGRAQPAPILVQPVAGFQVASVHSIELLSPMRPLVLLRSIRHLVYPLSWSALESFRLHLMPSGERGARRPARRRSFPLPVDPLQIPPRRPEVAALGLCPGSWKASPGRLERSAPGIRPSPLPAARPGLRAARNDPAASCGMLGPTRHLVYPSFRRRSHSQSPHAFGRARGLWPARRHHSPSREQKLHKSP